MKRETGWEVIGTALAVAVSVLMVALLSGCRADGTENLRRELEKARCPSLDQAADAFARRWFYQPGEGVSR